MITQQQLKQVLGDPTGKDGDASATWESNNLVYITPPFKMKMGDIPITRIRVHKLVAKSLMEVLNELWDKCNKSQAEIDRLHISRFSGAYNYRLKRGGSSLSLHAFGAAIDIDASNNAMGMIKSFFKVDNLIVKTFEKHGWTWGGRWSRKDSMHFEKCPKINGL